MSEGLAQGNEVDQDGVDVNSTVEEPENTPKQEELSKTFTQEEVNALIAERLNREKKKFADYDELKGKVDELETQNTDLNSKTQEYEAFLNEQLEVKKTVIPEELQDLIPNNLSTRETLSWIERASEKGLFTKKNKEPLGERTNAPSKGGLTKEQFTSMTYSERVALSNENPELYKQLARQ